MRRSERGNWFRGNWILMTLLAIALGIFGTFTFMGESASTAAQRFLVALATADSNTLADMSYFNPPKPRDEVKKEWEKSLEVGKFYRFVWVIKAQSSPVPGRASVQLMFTKDADKGNAYEENFSLDMLKDEGKWKVDVRGLSREMFPAMPR